MPDAKATAEPKTPRGRASKRGFKRARSSQHKAQRRQELLQAAADLMNEGGVDEVSLSAIAKRGGLSKSNLYTYFESREDVLMNVMLDDWGAWVAQAEIAMAPLAGSNDPALVAATLTGRYLDQPRLCELVSVLASVLEQNVSQERIAAFKMATLPLGIRMANMLHAALPALPIHTCVWVLRPLFALVAGFWPLANPPPNVAAVLSRPEFALHCVDVRADLERSIRNVLAGEMLAAKNE